MDFSNLAETTRRNGFVAGRLQTGSTDLKNEAKSAGGSQHAEEAAEEEWSQDYPFHGIQDYRGG